MDFIGRDALMKQRDEGVKRMYVQLIVQDHDHEVDLWPWGTEPVFRNGKYVGAITTTGYGFTFQKQVQSCVVLCCHALIVDASSFVKHVSFE
jgi:pyruvate dehydrogenase phosphatase regulatory subunit